jgi:hypothetical protein
MASGVGEEVLATECTEFTEFTEKGGVYVTLFVTA